jgi:molybdopterin biosynthesis enzyme
MVKKKATKSKAKSKSKSKKRAAAPTKRKAVSRATRSNSDEKYKAQYTTRHGSHLTKTTVGVSDTEADIKEEVE